MKENELMQRLFKFAVRTIKFLKALPNFYDVKIIRYQLIRSSSSSGANYEESQAGSSKADFTNKVRISLREMRESNYWLRLIKEVVDKVYDANELEWLINESTELKKDTWCNSSEILYEKYNVLMFVQKLNYFSCHLSGMRYSAITSMGTTNNSHLNI